MAREKYTSESLRQRLGETIEGLLDKENPIELDRAKAIADVAQVMINVAKVEIDHMRVTGGRGSGFIVEQKPEASEEAEGIEETRTGTISRPAPGVLMHKMRQ